MCLKNVWVYDAIWDNDLGNLDNRRQVWIIIGYETRIGNKGFFDWQQEKSLILQNGKNDLRIDACYSELRLVDCSGNAIFGFGTWFFFVKYWQAPTLFFC